MQTSTDLLDAVKTRLSLPSDYALSKRLGLTTASISLHRTKPHGFTYKTAAKIATLLDKNEDEIMLISLAERAKCAPEKAVYLRLLELVKSHASKGPPRKKS